MSAFVTATKTTNDGNQWFNVDVKRAVGMLDVGRYEFALTPEVDILDSDGAPFDYNDAALIHVRSAIEDAQ